MSLHDIGPVEMMTKILHDKSLLKITLATSTWEDANNVEDDMEQDVGETQERELQEDFGDLRKWVEGLPPMVNLSGKVTRTSDHPIASGGSQDIYTGVWTGQEVALAYPRNQTHAGRERFRRQVEIWRTLRHPNILQLLGIASVGDSVYSVSPYMEFGHVTRFLKAHPDADRVLLLSEIASATEYLHMNGIIHGDLQGSNVLISRDGHACLGDLGSARVEEVPVTETITYGALPPELVANSSSIPTTRATDVWSFGMLSLEIFTDKVPSSHAPNEKFIPFAIRDGPLPTRPEHANTRGLSDAMWDLMDQCRQRDPESRPSMSKIRETIQNIHFMHSTSQSSRPSISSTLPGSPHRSSISGTRGVLGGAPVALSSSGSSALSSGPRPAGSSSSQRASSTSRSSKLGVWPFRNRRSRTTPDTVTINNDSINNFSFSNASFSDLSFSNGPRPELDSIFTSLPPISSIHSTFSDDITEFMATRTPAITKVHEDEEPQPQLSIASCPVTSSGSMALNALAQHNFYANKDNTRSTARDLPSPNHVASSPEINSDSLLPGTPSSSNSLLILGVQPAGPPSPNRNKTMPSENWDPVSLAVSGLMEMVASDSECVLRRATDGTVSAANLEGLVFRVITDIEDPSRNDHFRATFLTIYELFATSERLFDILKRRFESSEFDPVAARSRYPILLFIESWLKKGFADEDLKCSSMIKELILPLVNSVTISGKMEAQAKEIARLIEDPDCVRRRQPKNCIALRSNLTERPQGVKPSELAAALTVVEGDRFKCITYWDYVNFTRWGPNVQRIEVFNIVHDLVKVWVQRTVLESDFVDERTKMYEEWIYTAKECRALNNFSSASAIVLALMSPLVTALALTSESKAKPDLFALAKELTPTDGVYQNALQKVATRKVIPCLDLHLSCLHSSFAHSNPIIEVDGHPLIDFKHCSEIAEQINTLVQYSPPRTRNTTRPEMLAYVEYGLERCRGDNVMRDAEECSARLASEERKFYEQRKKMMGLGFRWSPPRRPK